jgi:hypothetical protein
MFTKSIKQTKVVKKPNPYQGQLELEYVVLSGIYHNAQDVNIRRNESWRHSVVLKQSQLLDLETMCLVSRIHITDMRVAHLNVYVSEFEDGPFMKVCDELEVVHGKERVIKVGCLPCRFVKIEMVKGVPLLEM